MPSHVRIDRGFIVGADQTAYFSWNWFGDDPPDGSNKGPVVFQAVPKNPLQGGNNSATNVLATHDLAVCRAGPGEPGSPEVFYTFQITNGSSIDVTFFLEMIMFDDLPIQTFT